MRYSRQRTCSDCGKIDAVRKDNKAERCVRCSGRENGRRGIATIKARARVAICDHCGQQYRGRQKRFCSKKCWRASQAQARLKLTCHECGGNFERPPSILGTNASGKFCSAHCYHTFLCRTERVTGRGSRWNSVRKEALRLAPFCAMCGTRNGLQVHHAIPFRITNDNAQSNLFPLCVKHHRAVETIFVGTERHGLPPGFTAVWSGMLRQWQMATAMKIKQEFDGTYRGDMADLPADRICEEPAQE